MTKIYKHSTGPFTRAYGNYIYQGKVYDPNANQRLIATCLPTSKTNEDWDETFANAAVMSKAPEMKDVLIDAVALLEVFISPSGTTGPNASTKGQVISTIQEAKRILDYIKYGSYTHEGDSNHV